MPKLLQINACSNWGSTGKIAEQIGLKAKEAGWDSYLAYGRETNPSKLDLIKVGTMSFVYEHYVENRFLDREGLASRIPTYHLIKRIEKINPNVVHLHNIHDHWLNYSYLFKFFAKAKIPIVWTQHDCWGFTGHCAFTFDDCDKWKKGCNNCPHKFSFCLDQSKRNYELKKNLFASAKMTIVPVSEWLGGLVKESFLMDLPMKVIPNGVDITMFKPINYIKKDKYGIEGKFLVLGVATLWDSRKGIDDYFQLRNMLGDDFSIMMVGLSSEQIKSLPEGIIGFEKTSSLSDLVALYNLADVVLSLSKAETFGLTMVEAMACGTPVIGYNNTAHSEVVREGCGYIVETGDLSAIKRCLEYMKKLGKSKLSEKCISIVRGFYDKDKNFSEYISLYSSLLDAD